MRQFYKSSKMKKNFLAALFACIINSLYFFPLIEGSYLFNALMVIYPILFLFIGGNNE